LEAVPPTTAGITAGAVVEGVIIGAAGKTCDKRND